MKQNMQLETDKVISSLGAQRPTLLLQCCCGPCSSYVLEYLTQYFDVTILYYNPNIQPREESDKRRYWLGEVAAHYGEKVKTMECPYDGAAFDEAARGLENEKEGGERCTKCFELRLGYTAQKASENGFEYFCTTLSVSPYKDSERLNAIGFGLQEKYGVKWLPSDFKKRGGYQRSIELSKQYGLYRQEYCGCLYSIDISRPPKDGE